MLPHTYASHVPSRYLTTFPIILNHPRQLVSGLMLSLLAFFLSPILSDRRATINKAKNNHTPSRTRTLPSPFPIPATGAISNVTTNLLLRLLSLNYLN